MTEGKNTVDLTQHYTYRTFAYVQESLISRIQFTLRPSLTVLLASMLCGLFCTYHIENNENLRLVLQVLFFCLGFLPGNRKILNLKEGLRPSCFSEKLRFESQNNLINRTSFTITVSPEIQKFKKSTEKHCVNIFNPQLG